MRTVSTPLGEAQLQVHRASEPMATVVLTHGAGGGTDARDLVALAGGLPALGVSVTLVEMPWRVAGRRLAPAPPRIDEAYRAVVASMRPRVPLILGGRSAGARSACRIAEEVGAAGVLALAFPLHPPGRPEKSRLPELLDVGVSTLVVQGEKDPFGTPAEFPETLPETVRLSVVPSADHGMKVPKSAPITQAEALAVVVEATSEWVTGNHGG